jgi:hypothetical protein
MRFLAILACCAAFSGTVRAEGEAQSLHPLRVSFADMVRLSAGAPPLPEPAPGPRRVAFAAADADEALFSVRPVREPAWWLLLFSGLAAAGWVAHRRMVNPL